MSRNTFNAFHSIDLTQPEELRLIAAIQKKYGSIRGNVRTALREAVLQWIKRIEAE